MKSLVKKLPPLALAAALTAPLAGAAQAGAPSSAGTEGATPAAPARGPGRMGMSGRLYDPNTVATLTGEVTEVRRVAGPRHEWVELGLATPSGAVAVHLGPDFYVDRQAVKLAKGDQVEVTGSRVTVRGRPVLIAQQVRRGADVLALRDAAGTPRWAPARARR